MGDEASRVSVSSGVITFNPYLHAQIPFVLPRYKNYTDATVRKDQDMDIYKLWQNNPTSPLN